MHPSRLERYGAVKVCARVAGDADRCQHLTSTSIRPRAKRAIFTSRCTAPVHILRSEAAFETRKPANSLSDTTAGKRQDFCLLTALSDAIATPAHADHNGTVTRADVRIR
jgi:hypothetical protein